MLVEKFIIIGILKPKEVVIDLVKNSYENNIIQSVNMIKEPRNNIIIDFMSPFNTKNDAMKRLNNIYSNIDVLYWSIIPTIVDVPIQEARYLKLLKLKKKLFSCS